VYIGFRLDKSMTLSDLEYEGETVGYGQLSGLHAYQSYRQELQNRSDISSESSK